MNHDEQRVAHQAMRVALNNLIAEVSSAEDAALTHLLSIDWHLEQVASELQLNN